MVSRDLKTQLGVSVHREMMLKDPRYTLYLSPSVLLAALGAYVSKGARCGWDFPEEAWRQWYPVWWL